MSNLTYNVMDELNRELRAKAVELNMCQRVGGTWLNKKSKDDLCELYKSQLYFCIDNDYPSVGYMKEHFNGVMQKHGIFANDVAKVRAKDVLVFNGETVAYVEGRDYDVCTMFIRHDSRVVIHASGNAKLFVRVYDNSRVSITQKDNAFVSVILMGGKIASIKGDVKIKREVKA